MAPIDVELFMEHTRKRSIVEVLLRGHLWLENALIELIEAEVANPVPLKLDRMTFANKANLAEALGLLGSTDAGTLRALNKIRNRLAHDLHGEPTLDDLVLLERGLSQSQTDLAGKLSRADVSRFGAWPADSDHLVRLGMTILALLAEIEMHRQRHKYWKEHRQSIEAHRLTVAIQKKLGQEPETWDQWRAVFDIPDPPSPGDATV